MVFSKIKNLKKGFSMIEMLVVVAVFSIMLGIIFGVFISTVRIQRRYLAYQQTLDQVSYAMEYMTRALRMSKKQLDDPPLGCITDRCNYENPGADESKIKFIRPVEEGGIKCQEFYLDGGKIMHKIDGVALELTSDNLNITTLRFYIATGECQENLGIQDLYQPRVTIFLEGEEIKSKTKLKIQTTVSQRDIDIIE